MDQPTAQVIVSAAQAGWRADRALGALVADLGRRTAKVLFKARRIKLNGRVATGAERVAPGDRFDFPAPPAVSAILTKRQAPRLFTAHGRQVVRLYEDETVLVISKPAEVPVHRGAGGFTRRDTLEDVLQGPYPGSHHFVHRLDMETSGCLLVAKTEAARDALIQDFSARRVQKDYLAVVVGEVPWATLSVNKPLIYVRQPDTEAPRRRGRSQPILRGLKKAVALDEKSGEGKASRTEFRVVRRFKGYTLVHARPKTGRTHQIRIHLASTGYPLAYDPLYGRSSPLRLEEFDPQTPGKEAGEHVVLNRLPLHAWRLAFMHPVAGKEISVSAPLPRDLRDFLKLLRTFRSR